MAARLPRGLVTNSQGISGNIERVDRVAIEDISRLWQVYSTNKAILTDHVGFRLENFFWRIWGNGSIHSRITGSELALIFDEISQGKPIRTTPTQSPPFNTKNSSSQKEDRPSSPTPQPKSRTAIASPSTSSSKDEEHERSAIIVHDFASQAPQRPVTSQSSENGRVSTRLPPILKKSSPVPSAPLSKAARIQSPPGGLNYGNAQFTDEPQGVRAVKGLASRTSSKSKRRESQDEVSSARGSSDETNEPKEGILPDRDAASSTPRFRTPGITLTQEAAKKKTAFVASIAASRRRPSSARGKSSQSSSGTTSKDISPGPAGHSHPIPMFSCAISSIDQIDTTGAESSSSPRLQTISTELNTTSRSLYATAESQTVHPSRTGRPSLSPHTSSSSQNTASSFQNQTQDPLVSRDFRARFADRVPSKNVSFASLPTLAAKSKASLSIPTPTAQQACATNNGPQKRGILKSGGIENVGEIDAEQAESAIEDEEPEVVLPRTKSQLTLLLERHRRGEGVERGRKSSY